MKTTTLACSVDGARLDVFISDSLPGLTRSAAQKLLAAGRVTSDGRILRKNHRTSSGETYIITQDEPDSPAALRQDIRLDVVYEDADVIVVNKPQGMVVHPAPGHYDGTLVNALLYHCGDSLSGIGGVMRPGIVHRIDKDTSGLIIAAKNDKAHLSLAGQLVARTLTREYDALVCGNVKASSGTIDVPLGRHPADRKKQAAYAAKRLPDGKLPKGVREAVTHYEVIARCNGYTHVLCRLETGRTHQIRVHMAHIGHPVAGDRVYGRKKPEPGINHQCLHARRLRFIHPSTGEHVELCTQLPEYFKAALRHCGLDPQSPEPT